MGILEKLEELNSKFLYKEYKIFKDNKRLQEAMGGVDAEFDEFSRTNDRYLKNFESYLEEANNLINKFINSSEMIEDLGMLRDYKNTEGTNAADSAFHKVENKLLLAGLYMKKMNETVKSFIDFCKGNNILKSKLSNGNVMDAAIAETIKKYINPSKDRYAKTMDIFKGTYLDLVNSIDGLEDSIEPFDLSTDKDALSKRAEDYFNVDYFIKNSNKANENIK